MPEKAPRSHHRRESTIAPPCQRHISTLGAMLKDPLMLWPWYSLTCLLVGDEPHWATSQLASSECIVRGVFVEVAMGMMVGVRSFVRSCTLSGLGPNFAGQKVEV